jgi:hypothetical protein
MYRGSAAAAARHARRGGRARDCRASSGEAAHVGLQATGSHPRGQLDQRYAALEHGAAAAGIGRAQVLGHGARLPDAPAVVVYGRGELPQHDALRRVAGYLALRIPLLEIDIGGSACSSV